MEKKTDSSSSSLEVETGMALYLEDDPASHPVGDDDEEDSISDLEQVRQGT